LFGNKIVRVLTLANVVKKRKDGVFFNSIENIIEKSRNMQDGRPHKEPVDRAVDRAEVLTTLS